MSYGQLSTLTQSTARSRAVDLVQIDNCPYQEVARRYDPADVYGVIVCLHVLNVPGYQAQQRDIPISDHFSREVDTILAPFTGILVGVLENPVALPGHPLCHLVRVGESTRDVVEAEIERGEFDGYRARGARWRGERQELD